MRLHPRTITTLLLLLSPLGLAALVGCEEATIQSYVAPLPDPYQWPQTETREHSHKQGTVEWVWDVPAGFVDAPEVADLLVADYRFPGTNQDLPGRLTLSVAPGDGGGLQANLNRWRGQLYAVPAEGRAPDDSIESLPIRIGRATLVEFEGQFQSPHLPTHLAGAIVQVPAQDGSVFQTWFFKLVGDQATVNANRAAMIRMVLSLRPKGTPPMDLPDELFRSPPQSDPPAIPPAQPEPNQPRPTPLLPENPSE